MSDQTFGKSAREYWDEMERQDAGRMKKFKGQISTNIVGSECQFEFEMPDDATDKEIEETAKELAFDLIEWSYGEVED